MKSTIVILIIILMGSTNVFAVDMNDIMKQVNGQVEQQIEKTNRENRKKGEQEIDLKSVTKNVNLQNDEDIKKQEADTKNKIEKQMKDAIESNKILKEINENEKSENSKNNENNNSNNTTDNSRNPIVDNKTDNNTNNSENNNINNGGNNNNANYKEQNKDVEEIKTDTKNANDKRNEILNEFKKKLEENNQKTEIKQKTKQQIVADEFAIIVQDEKDINNKEIVNDELLEMASGVIQNEDETQKLTEKEYKKKYIEELKNSIMRKKEEQMGKFKNVLENTKVENIIEKFSQNDTEFQLLNNEIKTNTANKIKEQKLIKAKERDPEIFDITDTGVSDDLLYSIEFQKLLRSRIELKTTIDTKRTADLFPIPQEKQLNRFKTTDIPPELLSFERSPENKHIPVIITMEDFQYIAKNAIDDNDLSVLRGVVDYIKNPDYVLANGQTLLNYTATAGSIEILEYLIYSGANIDIQDLIGNTALHNSILRNDNIIIKILTTSNSNLNIMNVDGYTPLMLSIVNGKDDIAMFLLKFNQDLFLKNYRGEDCIELANKYNRLIIKELIIDKIKNSK